MGQAYLAGFQRAHARGAELVVVMDADGSHDPAYLPALIGAAAKSDLVLGSRYVAGGSIVNWPRLRRFLSRSGSFYARRILGVDVRDLTSGFRCVRREVLEAIEPSTLRSQGYVFNIELTYRALLAGFTVTELPICFRDRERGQSKMSLPIAFEALVLVPKLRLLRADAWRRRADEVLGASRRVGRRWPRRTGAGDVAANGSLRARPTADDGAPAPGDTADAGRPR